MINQPPVLRYMNPGNSSSANPNTSANNKKSEKKDVNNEKINYKIIKNYHNVFLKEKVIN